MGMNRRVYRDLREAEMEENQAEIIASHIPDWSQFATKQDIAELKSSLMRWQWVQLGAVVALLTALRFISFAA